MCFFKEDVSFYILLFVFSFERHFFIHVLLKTSLLEALFGCSSAAFADREITQRKIFSSGRRCITRQKLASLETVGEIAVPATKKYKNIFLYFCFSSQIANFWYNILF